MTSSNLNQLLLANISLLEFRNSIDEEVAVYALQMTKKGSTIPLHFVEDETIQLDNKKLKTLIMAAVDGRLSNIHLSYICDCLTLGEKVNYENNTLEIIHDLADPEINDGYKSKGELLELISNLQ